MALDIALKRNERNWVDPLPEDLNDWAALGNEGWSYEDVLPFFKKIEHTKIGDDAYHGRTGLLGVEYANPMLEVSNFFIKAAVESGLKYNPDINGPRQDGVSATPCSIFKGIRQSTALAYLKPARKRKNLRVITGALVHRVIVEGNKAVAVEFKVRGRLQTEYATKEIVLSAGALRSPQILLLSGIGPTDQLKKYSIPQAQELPGVGSNHMEHPTAYVTYEVDIPTWCSEVSLLKQAIHGLNWLFRKKGPVNSSMVQAVAFIRSENAVGRPDLQFQLIPFGLHPRVMKYTANERGREIVTVLVSECQPGGRGRVELASADPGARPAIYPQLLASENSVKKMTAGIKKLREVFRASSISSRVKQELKPGLQIESDAMIEDWLRSTVIDGIHPCGTCKMGQDELAVVDERLRVRNIQNLRVVDASIMPTITTGNTNAPTIMIAEKGAAMILEDNHS